MSKSENKKNIEILNKILEIELAGVVRYTHYALMIYGFNRLPIIEWMRSNAQESLLHAQRAGEFVTLLGGHPSLKIGDLLETEKHDMTDILSESLAHENKALKLYYDLLDSAIKSKSIILEEYAREMIVSEELHADEVNKMLRHPGDIGVYRPR